MTTLPQIDPKFLNSITEKIKEFQKSFEPIVKKLPLLIESYNKLPDSVKLLANKGWYLPLSVTPGFINALAALIENRKQKDVDGKMIDLINNEVDNIEQSMTKNFPDRKLPLEAAFRAHRQREYFVSIPVFYSQTEGIFEGLTETRFFSINGKQGIPKSLKFAQQIQNDTILSHLIEPLRHISEVNRAQNLKSPSGINRHDVLHGASIDYGTEINSYKAISLVSFVGETVQLAKQHLDNKKQ